MSKVENIEIDFWKLLVYVKKNDTGHEEICVDLEESTWIRQDPNHIWHRCRHTVDTSLCYWVCHLDANNECHKETAKANTQTNHLYAKNGKIHFEQGRFLKIEGLIPPADRGKGTFGYKRFGQRLEHFTGRHIHAEITFEAKAKWEDDLSYPLFYLAQSADTDSCQHALRFGEAYAREGSVKRQRRVYWQISGQNQVNTGEFSMCAPFEYTLTINQDRERYSDNKKQGSSQYYFEFLADAVPLPMEVQGAGADSIKIHKFHPSPRLLYIGYDPKCKTTFEGSIRRLMLDPNSSCDGC